MGRRCRISRTGPRLWVNGTVTGNFSVVVQFFTEEVRVDPNGFLKDQLLLR